MKKSIGVISCLAILLWITGCPGWLAGAASTANNKITIEPIASTEVDGDGVDHKTDVESEVTSN